MNRFDQALVISPAERSRWNVLWRCVALGAVGAALLPCRLEAEDCNGNGVSDAEDIARGVSTDCNGNGVPDECDPLFPSAVPRSLTGKGPEALVSSDLDGDGRLDLATANRVSSDISVLLGNGDATFKAEQRFGVGAVPYHIVAVDFDGDARPDLATANSSTGISVLLGNGDGTFQPEQRFAAGMEPVSLVAADFDGDALPDIATANLTSNDVSVLLGTGDGAFQAEQRFAAGLRPSSLVAADFDADGHLDLATGNRDGVDTSVLLGNGDGTFQAEQRVALGGGWGLVAADLNGDGRLDLAGASGGLSLGNGDGTFQAEQRFGLGGRDIIAADLNGDGRLDLMAGGVHLGNGDGTFQAEKRLPGGGENMAAADFDGDGRLDLATARSDSNDLSVLVGNGDGTFKAEAEPYSVTVGSVFLVKLIAADLNGDGRFDLANGGIFSNDIGVLLGKGDGTFQEEQRFPAGVPNPSGLVAADFNGDDRIDLATAGLESNAIAVLLGNGDGTFQFERLYSAPSGLALVAADFDRDGWIDLASMTYSSNWPAHGIAVLLGNGDGTFQAEQRVALETGWNLVAADFNGDGGLDLATSAGYLHLGNGDGTFEAGQKVAPGGYNIVAADFNGDARSDLATVGGETRRFSILLGNGDGTFMPGQHFALDIIEDPFQGFAASDLDGDGRTDLAASSGGDLKVFLANGDGTFKSSQHFAVCGGSMILADFNRDGRTEIVTGGGSCVSLLLNRPHWDQTPPLVQCPEALSVECTGPAGAVVDFRASSADACDPTPNITYDPPPGSLFPVGSTIVTCTAADAAGNQSQCSFEIQVTCSRQVPSDCNQDGTVDISDALCLLGFLFVGSPTNLPCGDGTGNDPANRQLTDWNGDSGTDVSDAVSLLGWLFLRSPPHVLGSDCRPIAGCPGACRTP